MTCRTRSHPIPVHEAERAAFRTTLSAPRPRAWNETRAGRVVENLATFAAGAFGAAVVFYWAIGGTLP
jgi:hypothetical protein